MFFYKSNSGSGCSYIEYSVPQHQLYEYRNRFGAVCDSNTIKSILLLSKKVVDSARDAKGLFQGKIMSRCLLYILLIFTVSSLCVWSGTAPKPSLTGTRFVANKGQWNKEALFCSKTSQGTTWITGNGVVFDFYSVDVPSEAKRLKHDRTLYDSLWMRGQVVRMTFSNSTNSTSTRGVSRLKTKFNYLLGNDRSKWATNVPQYKEAVTSNMYKNIGLRYYIENGALRYDVNVQQGGNPQDVSLQFEGVDDIQINSKGELVLHTVLGDIVQQKLVAYQIVNKKKEVVPCSFIRKEDGTVGFETGAYNKNKPLIIDPIVWATFIGGELIPIGRGKFADNVPGTEDCFDIALDASNNSIVCGVTQTTDFPTTTGAYKRVISGVMDPFVAKVAANGSSCIFVTYIGGGDNIVEHCSSVAVDQTTGNIFICGMTGSSTYPTTASAYLRTFSGDGKGFISVLSPNGNGLVASTLLGGSPYDELTAITLDNNNVYVTGFAWAGYPTSASAYRPTITAGYSTIVSVMPKNLQTLTSSTYIGGLSEGRAIAVDGSGNIHITGVSFDGIYSCTNNAVQKNITSELSEATYSKLNNTCSNLLYSTYFGSTWEEEGHGIGVDASGNAYICGLTSSPGLYTTVGAYDRSFNSIPGGRSDTIPTIVFDGFVTKFNGNTGTIDYSTYLGGKASDVLNKIRVDAAGYAYLTGTSYSTNYPVTNCTADSTLNGKSDAVISILSPAGNVLQYSSFLGAGGKEFGYSIAKDNLGQLYICGTSSSGAFPVTTGAAQTLRKQSDGFVCKFDPIQTFTVHAGNDFWFSCSSINKQIFLGAVPSCGTPPYTYSWSPGNILNDSTDRTPWVTTSTLYQEFVLTCTDATGKVAKNTVALIPQFLTIIPGSDTSICWGRNTKLNTDVTDGLGPLTYVWYPSYGLNNPYLKNPMAQPDSTTQYIMVVRDTSGCEKADTVKVFISRGKLYNSHDSVSCGSKQIKVVPDYRGAIPPYVFKWTDKAGNTVSTVQSPTLTVDSVAMFYLTITDSVKCVYRDSIQLRYSPPTLASFKGDTVVCKGQTANVKLSVSGGTKPYRIIWTASDSVLTLTSTDSTVSAPITKDTKFYANIVDVYGCRNVFEYQVRIDSIANPKIKTGNNKAVICQGGSIQLDAGTFSNATYLWSTGDKSQRITVNKEGWYKVTLTGNKTGCKGSDSVYITVQPTPTPQIASAPDTTICEGGSATIRIAGNWKSYKWSNGDVTPTTTVIGAGEYYATVTDSIGCTGVSNKATVKINTFTASINGPNSLCANVQSTYTVDKNPNWQYAWTIKKSGIINSGQGSNQITAQWSADGTDSITVVINDTVTHCITARTFGVSITSTIKPSISSKTSPVLCGNGSSIQLDAPAGYTSYDWSNGEKTQSITVTQPGDYTVKVTSGGCSGTSDPFTVKTAPPISVSVQGKQQLCRDEQTTLSATLGFASYKWSSNETTETITITKAGTYSVVVTDTNGCTATNSLTVSNRAYGLQGATPLTFSKTLIYNNQQQTTSVTNMLSEDVIVESCFLVTNAAEISIVSTQPPIKATISPTATFTVTLKFAPTAEQDYSDTLVVLLSAPCPDTIRIPVQGQGSSVDNRFTSFISMPDTAFEAGVTNVSIPVTVGVANNQTMSSFNCTISASFDARLFFPTGVSAGTWSNPTDDPVNNIRTVNIALTNVTPTAGSVITSIIGNVLINTPNKTTLSPQLLWESTPQPVSINVKNGSLSADGCFVDGRALQIISKAQMLLSPNPTNSDINIVVSSGEKGIHTVKVYNTAGTVVAQNMFYNASDMRTEQQSIPDVASGVYVVVLQSPSGTQSQKVMVVR